MLLFSTNMKALKVLELKYSSVCQLFASVYLVSGHYNFCVLLSAVWRKFSKQTRASSMLKTLHMEEHLCTGQKLLR